jgi:hypothetical protein
MNENPRGANRILVFNYSQDFNYSTGEQGELQTIFAIFNILFTRCEYIFTCNTKLISNLSMIQ